jgi:hypothetical protein
VSVADLDRGDDVGPHATQRRNLARSCSSRGTWDAILVIEPANKAARAETGGVQVTFNRLEGHAIASDQFAQDRSEVLPAASQVRLFRASEEKPRSSPWRTG